MTAAPRLRATLDRMIARNTIFVLLGRLIYVVGWTLITPFMIARLGMDRFGLWSLITVFSGLYMAFDLGLQSALTKFVAEFRAAGNVAALRGIFTLGTVLYGSLSAVFIVAIIVLRVPLMGFFRIAPGLQDEAMWAIVGAAVTYGVLNFYMLLGSVLGGLQRLDLWNRITITATLLQLLGVWLVLSAGGGVVALVVNTGVSLVFGILLSRWAVRRLAPEIRFDPSSREPGLLTRFTHYSVALQIINIGALVQFQLDKVLFGRFVSLAAVGNYELGFRVTSAFWSLPVLLLPALLPAVAHLDASGERERIVRLYHRASRYVMAVAFPLAAAIMVLAPVLFLAWLGPGHDDAALAAAALAALMGVNILTGVGSCVVRGVGRPGLEAEYHVLSIVLHVALSLVLIPRIGFVGGLWALFLSGAVGSVYFLWRFHGYLREPLGRFTGRVLARPLVAAAAGALAARAVVGWGGDVQGMVRVEALVRLGAGGIALLVVVAVVLLATRHVSVPELIDLARLGLGRARGRTLEDVK